MNKSLKKSFRLLLAVAVLVYIGNSCKKIDTAKEEINKQQIDLFLHLPENHPPELEIIIDAFRKQLCKEDFTNLFLQWHGQPQWQSVIKLNRFTTNSKTLIIPTKLQTGEIVAFIAATILKDGTVQFELHRKAMIEKGKKEFSVVGLTADMNKLLFKYFGGNIANADTAIKNGTSNYVEEPICWWRYEQVSCNESVANSNNAPESIAMPRPCYGWVEYCDEGGGGGGGGGGGCYPFAEGNWWYNIILPPNPCDSIPPPPPTQEPCSQFILNLELNGNFVNVMKYLNSNAALGLDNEVGYEIRDITQYNSASYIPGTGSTSEPTIQWNFPANTVTDGLVHSHYAGLNSIFTPQDIIIMAQLFIANHAKDTNNLFFAMTSSYSLPFLMKVGHPTIFRAFCEKIVGANGNDIKKMDNFAKDFYNKVNTENPDVNEREFLKIIKDYGAGNGLQLFQGDNNCNKWTKREIDNFGTVSSVPCMPAQ
jgi:hypothetical protein